MADLFFLIMLRVVAILSAQDDRSGKARVAKFAVRTFAAVHAHKSGSFQFRNQLTDFSRHTYQGSIGGCAIFVNSFRVHTAL